MSPRVRLASLALLVACDGRGERAKKATSTGAATIAERTPNDARAPSDARAPAAAHEIVLDGSSPQPSGDLLPAARESYRDASAWTLGCNDDLGAPKAAKSVGNTSVVFKLELSDGRRVAWKPNAKQVKGRYRGEIAAFRLARALGIPNVPSACFRAFEASTVLAAFAANETAAKLFASEVIVEKGEVRGAVIPWIEGLQFLPLERDPLRTDMRAWLRAGGAIPPAKMDLARQVSTLVAFDFLIGNWDRYSGQNVGLDSSGAVVLFIDNDAAFLERPPKEHLARNRALLEATDRFSRSFVAAAQKLDRERLREALGEEAPGTPLLSDSVIATMAARAKVFSDVVTRKVDKHGEQEALFFP